MKRAPTFLIHDNADGSITVVHFAKLESKANARDHWRTAAHKAKEHRALGFAMANAVEKYRPAAPWVITLTRFGKRDLDDDNLATAFKATRDGIADALVGKLVMHRGKLVMRGNDSDPRLTWQYKQERGDYAISVNVRTRGETT